MADLGLQAVLYYGAEDNNVYALDASPYDSSSATAERLVWKYTTGDTIYSTPVLSKVRACVQVPPREQPCTLGSLPPACPSPVCSPTVWVQWVGECVLGLVSHGAYASGSLFFSTPQWKTALSTGRNS